MPSQSGILSVTSLLHCCISCTSDRSTSGGPSAMSSALVPGRILRAALWSRLLKSFCCSGFATGDSWSSGIGGGLGRRGDAGDAMAGRTGGRGYGASKCSMLLSRLRLDRRRAWQVRQGSAAGYASESPQSKIVVDFSRPMYNVTDT